MDIQKIEIQPDIKPGRPGIYPFNYLKPGEKLIIPGNEDLTAHKLSVRASLNYFKKSNAFNWHTVVTIEDNNIVAYRLT